jgi:acylphosphatase
MRTVHLVVRGRVQRVYFRASTLRKANELGIGGTVTNLPDGSVEIYAQGERLGDFVRWCGTGPAFARVDGIDARDIDRPEYPDFRVLR